MNTNTSSYISTRGGGDEQSFSDVLLSGLAPDGGLFVPKKWPVLEMDSLDGSSYSYVANHVLSPFVGNDIPEEVLQAILLETYSEEFTHPAVAPLVQLDDDTWLMELFHGPTLAFKDYAMQVLGRLFDHVLGQKNERITIVGATSGDTGSAAIEACKRCHNIDIFILHPKDRVSEVQRRQMTTVDAANVFNIAIEGTFDDCQALVKAMFGDESFREDMKLSAVNSINWARIMPQIVYYVTASLKLGAPVSFAVPTGNFGNIFAAYAAQQMGLSMGDLIIGSNRNDILTRFFESGVMKTENVEPSLSPSMDIQISSNFERYLFELLGRDAKAVSKLMDEFKTKGEFFLGDNHRTQMDKDFKAYRCRDEQTLETIASVYKENDIIIDPHTAVGLHAARQAGSKGPVVSLACAHPAKFPDAVEKAIGVRPELPDHIAAIMDKEEHVTVLPNDQETIQHFVKESRIST